MIQSQMKQYPYYLVGQKNSYGEEDLDFTSSSGSIEMAINILSQAVEESILYSDAEYIGLTRQDINDNYIIEFDNKKLKVKYVNKLGRLNQVFLKGM